MMTYISKIDIEVTQTNNEDEKEGALDTLTNYRKPITRCTKKECYKLILQAAEKRNTTN